MPDMPSETEWAGDQGRLPQFCNLAEAYVPMQEYGSQYSPEEALERGTLWPALYRPFSCRLHDKEDAPWQ